MKKVLCILLAAVLMLTVFSACGEATPTPSPSPVKTPKPTPAPQSLPDEFLTITTSEPIGVETTCVIMPDSYKDGNAKKGKVVRIFYTTDVYENGVTYDKYCNVYLPYCYDESDKETKYNIMYFQHGNTGSPEGQVRLDEEMDGKLLLDSMFDPDRGGREPVIVVFPSYYLNLDPNKEELAPNVFYAPDDPAGDGRSEGIVGNYYKEVVEDLIPAVESQFNVYAESLTKEGIKASRDHRAWTGYSRGCMCTYDMFNKNFEYFKWYMPMSCQSYVGDGSDEAAFNYLKEPIEANPDLSFFIYGFSGNKFDAEGQSAQFKYYMTKTDVFSFGKDPSVNNLCYATSEFDHADVYGIYYYYNALEVLFK